MITRGIITYSDSDAIKVYIPILDGLLDIDSIYDENIKNRYQGTPVTSILAIPGVNVEYKLGDTVLIGFEDNLMSNPIILGFLKSALDDNSALPNLVINNLLVNNKLTAPTNVSFGDKVLNFNDIYNSVNNLEDSSL